MRTRLLFLVIVAGVGCASYRPPDATRIPPVSVPGPDIAIRTTQPSSVPTPGPAGLQGPAGAPGRDADLATLQRLEQELAQLKRAHAADQAGSGAASIATVIPGFGGLGAGILAMALHGLGYYRQRQIDAKQKQLDQFRADLGLPPAGGPLPPSAGDPVPPQSSSGTAPPLRQPVEDLLRLGLTQLTPEQLAQISIQYDRLSKLLQPVLNGMVAAKEVLDQTASK